MFLPHDLIKDISERHYIEIEQRLRYIIKPRPWWLPAPIWKWLIKQLLAYELTQED